MPAPVRVAAVQQSLGAVVQPGQPVLTVTPTAPVVTLDVPIAQASLVHRGDTVTVTLPSGAVRPGRVASVSPVATDGGSGEASAGPTRARGSRS